MCWKQEAATVCVWSGGTCLGRDVVVVLLLVVLLEVELVVLLAVELAPPWLGTQEGNVPGVVNVIWSRVGRGWMRQVPVQVQVQVQCSPVKGLGRGRREGERTSVCLLLVFPERARRTWVWARVWVWA